MAGQDNQGRINVREPRVQEGYTRVPNTILRHQHLSMGAKLTYAMLLSYAWYNNSCFPGQKTLADDIGTSERSVRTYLKELQDAGLLEVERHGLGQTNEYTLAEWVEPSVVRIRAEDRSENIAAPMRKSVSATVRMNLPTKQTQLETDELEELDPLALYLYHLLDACKPDDRAEVRAHLAELGNGERVGRAIGRAEMEWDRRKGPREFWKRVAWWMENGG